MKQIFLTKGSVVTHEVIPPSCKSGCVLIKTTASCISAGTEMMGVNNSKKSLLSIAKEKPKTAIKFARLIITRGPKFVANTVKNIRGSDFGKEMGYSAAGVVIECGKGANDFRIGQRIAAVGTKVANHAGYNCVPINLAIPVPDGVSDEDASTAALGGIAFQGVRRLNPVPGDSVIVMGLGFIGMLTAQMLVASGCRVTGIDINPVRLAEARDNIGINVLNGNDPVLVEKALMLNNGNGFDGVIFTAATKSSAPMSSCFNMLRRRGVFVLSGVSGMEIKREDIYPKEIDFRMATSYGPGRYDQEYETKGNDYPEEYVRFTIKRNIEAYFELISQGKISLNRLDKNVVSVEKAGDAFERLNKPNPPMISIITYSEEEKIDRNKIIINKEFQADKSKVCFAIIGTGGYASNMHLPNLSQMQDKYQLKAIMNRSPGSAAGLAVQYHAAYYTTNVQDIFDDKDIQMVMVCTRHNSHADYVCRALEAGKDVFVEKPLAISMEELDRINSTAQNTDRLVMVGYNRRFSAYIQEVKNRVKDRKTPLIIDYSMCAGFIPYDVWMHGAEGGGRIVGEGCHIVDTCKYLVGSPVKSISVIPLRFDSTYFRSDDNVSFSIEYEDGSVATIRYLSCNADAVPKECMKVFCDGAEIYMNDYTSMTSSGMAIKKVKTLESDKGQKDILLAWHKALTTRQPAIPLKDIIETTKVTFDVRNEITTENKVREKEC